MGISNPLLESQSNLCHIIGLENVPQKDESMGEYMQKVLQATKYKGF
jgi:hypothetical protein